MNVAALDTVTDNYAKTDSTMFPVAEKLRYYNVAYGLLYGLIIDQQEENYESEPTAITTLASTGNYSFASRLNHVNWVKVNYGDGLVPATYRTYLSLVTEFGNQLEDTLDSWPTSDPIYWLEAGELNIRPIPTASQAGAGRLTYSAELYPADLTTGSPDIPDNFHYLLAVYAAWQYHLNNGEDGAAQRRNQQWNEGAALMIETAFPRARQSDITVQIPDEDGSDL